MPKTEVAGLSAGWLLQHEHSRQGAVPISPLSAGLIPQTARASLNRRNVCGKPDVLVCVSGTAPGHRSQTLSWPNCTDVEGAAVAQVYAFLSSEEQLWEGTDTRETTTINSSATRGILCLFPFGNPRLRGESKRQPAAERFGQPEHDSSPVTSAWRSSTREGCGSERRPSLPAARPLASLHLINAFY